MHIIAFLISAVVLTAFPVGAQQPSDQNFGFEASESLITFVIQGQLPTADHILPSSDPLLDRLDDQPALARLDVEGGGDAARVVARFVFPNRTAFDAWYASEGTKNLLRELADWSADEVNFAFTLKRYPYARMFER